MREKRRKRRKGKERSRGGRRRHTTLTILDHIQIFFKKIRKR